MSDTPEWTTHGVGPWVGEVPSGAQWDPELLANGDTRNVIDRYRYWRMEAIVADLDERVGEEGASQVLARKARDERERLRAGLHGTVSAQEAFPQSKRQQQR